MPSSIFWDFLLGGWDYRPAGSEAVVKGKYDRDDFYQLNSGCNMTVKPLRSSRADLAGYDNSQPLTLMWNSALNGRSNAGVFSQF
jgi:hypothetical protein